MNKLPPGSNAMTQAVTTGPSPMDLKRLSSRELFSAGREVVIEHAGYEYRLRLTNQGKLILTK